MILLFFLVLLWLYITFISNCFTFYHIVHFVFLFLLNTANSPYQHMQNQQYTSNYQHQHPPHLSQHQISLYNGSNQFEQQHLPPTQQQQNINFIHAVSSTQQHPFRGDDGLSAAVVRRQKRPPIAIGKYLNKMNYYTSGCNPHQWFI